MGEGQGALATLERLAKSDAALDNAHLLKAEAYLQIGDLAAMQAELKQDGSAESWRLRALGAMVSGKPADASEAFIKGRNAKGDKAKLYTAEASFRLSRNDLPQAREAVALAQQTAPRRIETLFVTARLADAEGNPSVAARAFMAILERAPDDRPALLGALAALDMLDRADLQRPLVERGRRLYPRDQEFRYREALLAAGEGNWAEVRRMLQEEEGDVPSHLPSRGLYGEALLELGQLEAARSYLAPVNRRDPDNARVARAYARLLEAKSAQR